MQQGKLQSDCGQCSPFFNDVEVFDVFQLFGTKLEDLRENKLLYHYTDAGGLQGIVKQQAIWATHYKYTNDFKEVRHGIEIILEEIRKRLDKKGNTHTPTRLLLQLLDGMINKGKPFSEFFVCCFSEEGNLLSQWRAYARDGIGYSIGYSPEDLGRLHQHFSNEPVQLLSVIYKKNKQREFARNLLEWLIPNFESYVAAFQTEIVSVDYENWSDDCKAAICRANAAAFKWLLAAAVRLKHEGFSEEREWRLIYPVLSHSEPSPPLDIKHRTPNGQLTPYVAIPLKAPIRKIWIGPKQPRFESQVADYAVRSLFQQAKVAVLPEIVVSGIPYR